MPRRVRTWSGVAPLGEKSEAKSVRNSVLSMSGEEEMEPLVGCAGQ